MSSAINGDAPAGRCETDRISALELQSNKRMLYFSDGVMEELSSSDSEADADVPDKAYDVQLQREMALGPRLRYKASKMGNNILAGIDYVGGGLASFLGITNSKYASELRYHQRAKEQAEADAAADDEDLDNWQTHANHNNNRNDSVVVCAPACRDNGLGGGMDIMMAAATTTTATTMPTTTATTVATATATPQLPPHNQQ